MAIVNSIDVQKNSLKKIIGQYTIFKLIHQCDTKLYITRSI